MIVIGSREVQCNPQSQAPTVHALLCNATDKCCEKLGMAREEATWKPKLCCTSVLSLTIELITTTRAHKNGRIE